MSNELNIGRSLITLELSDGAELELSALRAEVEKLRKQNALMAVAFKWKDEEVHPQTVIHDEFRAMLAEQERDALRTKCERLEAALIVMGGLVRAAIDGNAATRQDVILQIGRMISQALNEEGDK